MTSSLVPQDLMEYIENTGIRLSRIYVYLKLWIPESPNARRLKELRELIDDRKELPGRIDVENENPLYMPREYLPEPDGR